MPTRNSVLDIRRRKMRELIRKWGGPGSLSKKLGYRSGSFIAQIAGPNPTRDITEKLAREIEGKLELPQGWLDREVGAPAKEVNLPLVAEVVRFVTSLVQDAPKKADPSKVADVVALVYEHAAATGQVDEAYARRLLKLTE